MRIKLFFLLFILSFAINFSCYAKASDLQAEDSTSEEIDSKIKQEISDQKKDNEKQVDDIKVFLPSIDNIVIDTIEKNGQSIIEINSNILNQENGQALFYIKDYVKDSFIFYSSESNTFEYKNKLYSFTGNPTFRFKLRSAPEGKIDLYYDGSKIKIKSQENYVTTDLNLRIQDGAFSAIRQDSDYPINFFPSVLFKKAINSYKDYGIKSAQLLIDQNILEYQVKLNIKGKILWMFDTNFDLEAMMNASNGKISVEKPWWETFVF
ncbi:MAG: hypothetical protein PHN19_00140 [Patescibacteria group bacterium]|nr:hypothetical protein [Patescibacteria group bacterium]